VVRKTVGSAYVSSAENSARSGQVCFGRAAVWRCRTVSWWRSRRISASFLRAPGDDPDVVPLPVRADRIQLQPRLAGLINEYQQSA